MSIEWNNSLAIGVAEIDDQHKELFSRFDSLLTACNEGKGRGEVLRVLLFLDDYIKSHFAAEERLQLKHDYPGYPAKRSTPCSLRTLIGWNPSSRRKGPPCRS